MGKPRKGQGQRWRPEQDEFLRAHADWQDADICLTLALLGPARTPLAVRSRRYDLKLPMQPATKPRGAEFFRQWASDKDDWPAMSGSHRKRDRLFQEALWTAQLDLVRTLNAAAA